MNFYIIVKKCKSILKTKIIIIRHFLGTSDEFYAKQSFFFLFPLFFLERLIRKFCTMHRFSKQMCQFRSALCL
jgi:hypothetical protein